jgi:hypothetical protein
MFREFAMHISTRNPNATPRRRDGRNGIVLLVVIAMLALFATVGLTFVYYSESEATNARIHRISVSSELRDIPPDLILSQVLSQIVYGTDDTSSKFYGTSLAQNMYGGPGGRFAYSGTGFNLDPKSGVTMDQYATTTEFKFGKANAPYTFPDMNNPYLGAIDGNGNVIYRSYFRSAQPWSNPNGGSPTTPQFNAPTGVQSLRASSLPPLPNAYEGDLKNVMGAPSVKLPDGIVVTLPNNTQVKVFVDGTMLDASSGKPAPIANGTLVKLPDGNVATMNNGTTTLNDSVWMDPNIGGETKEGIKYKILVAPFIVDLDGRVNLSTAGGTVASTTTGITSRWGQGPWEINPLRLNDPSDATAMTVAGLSNLINNANMPSRFSGPTPVKQMPANWLDTDSGLPPAYSYYPMRGTEPNLSLASMNALSSVPYNFPPTWTGAAAPMSHPGMFDWFNSIVLNNHGSPITERRLAASNAEALLRFNEAGSPALTSDVLRNMPGFDFARPTHQAVRNLVTPYSMSVDVPHLPACVPIPGSYKFPVVAQGAVNAIPVTGPTTNALSWTNASADQMLPGLMVSPTLLTTGIATASGFRYNLNQPLPSDNYLKPVVTFPDENQSSRAARIFANLRNITGLSSDPTPWTSINPAPWKYNPANKGYTDATTGTQIDVATYRYLAQIAANMVDYTDSDNLDGNAMTVFNWTGRQNDKDVDFVIGVEQPRLVLNEAYATWDNDAADPGLTPKAGAKKEATMYRLNVFFELLNPTMSSTVALNNGTPVYRVLVAKDTSGLDSNGTGAISAAGAPTNPVKDGDTGNPVIVSNWNQVSLAPNAANQGNTGFLLVGPPVIPQPKKGGPTDNFLPPIGVTPPSPLAKYMRRPSIIPDYMDPGLSIKVLPPNNDASKEPTLYTPTLVLQRLADPRYPFNDSITATSTKSAQAAPGSGYNPWVTVDYFENVPVNPPPVPNNPASPYSSLVTLSQIDVTPADLNTFASWGRKQPLKAFPNMPAGPKVVVPGNSAVVAQDPVVTPPSTDKQLPKTTFRRHNGRNPNPVLDATDPTKAATITIPFDWYIHLDRPLLNRGELMSVSTGGPALLTHHNGVTNWTLGEAMSSPNTLLARLLESTFVPSFEYNAAFNQGGTAPPGSINAAPLVRVPGKINMNTAFDQRIFEALFDPQGDSAYQSYKNSVLQNNPYFTKVDVDRFYALFDMYRKNMYPGNQGTPTGPVAGFSDFYLGNTTGNPVPRGGLMKMMYQSPIQSQPSTPTSPIYYGLSKLGSDALQKADTTLPPYARDEAIRKIINNVTFTSNTFAVWLTVGFFETRQVIDPNTNQPKTQLVELFSEDNRQIRHRMFAIVDRSQLVMPSSTTPLSPPTGQNPAVGIAVTSVPGTGTTPAQLNVSNYVSYVLGVGPNISGRVAGNFTQPVGVLSLDWKFTVGGTIQIGDPTLNVTPKQIAKVGQIVAVTPSTTAAGNATIEVAFPKINGQPPPAINVPRVGDAIRFPAAITQMPTPFTENVGFNFLSNGATDLKGIQYGYPGPQPRFNVADNPLVVPYYSIID